MVAAPPVTEPSTQPRPPADGLPHAPHVDLVKSPWATLFYRLAEQAEEELLIASPFPGAAPVNRLARLLGDASRQSAPRLHIVTNLSVDSILSGSLDVAALAQLAQGTRNTTITYLPSLHAKVYVFDARAAIVTSGNLTHGGLVGNHEYGVLLRDPALVGKVRHDLNRYALLGNSVSTDTLDAVASAVGGVAAVRRQADTTVSATVRDLLNQRTDEARLQLLRAQALGRTTHGILVDTVLYLLETQGPLSTADMHPMVRQLHPDLCDDSIDRVIGDVHFGKRWKHYVRNAQQALKRQGLIALDQGQWRSAADPRSQTAAD